MDAKCIRESLLLGICSNSALMMRAHLKEAKAVEPLITQVACLTTQIEAFNFLACSYSGYDFDKPLVRRIEHAIGLLKEARMETCET